LAEEKVARQTAE
jgi:cell shape-determining protein MreC